MSNQSGQPRALVCPKCGAGVAPAAGQYSVCQHCGSHLVWNTTPGTGAQGITGTGSQGMPEAGAQAAPETVVRGVRLKQIIYVDQEVTQLELFRMLIPVGWNFQGGCRWLLDVPAMPAAVGFQVANPYGGEAFEVMPNMIFSTNGPPGSHSFGVESQRPVAILDAFRRYVLPRYRGSFRDLSILHEEVLPDLPRMVKSEAAVSPIGQAEGGKVRVRYSWNNWQFDEEMYGVVELFRTPVATMFSSRELIVWFIDYLFSFRSIAGRLDGMADLFGVMLRSFHLNPEWYAAFKSIAQILSQRQIQRIHSIGQMGQIYAQVGREMRQENLDLFYANQAVHDRLTTDWSRTIRDVDGFYDPHREEVVELPSGYGNAWANNLGEYVLTEDPNFNPNIGSNLHWEPMKSV